MAGARKHALITGAASGLGRALAVRLARDGWDICVADLNDVAAAESVGLIEKAGGSGFTLHLDVTKAEEWDEALRQLQSRWDRIDLLVNNAGVAGAGLVGSFSLPDWKWVIDVNLWSVIYGCHTFVDWLKKNPEGAYIINTASFAGIASAPGMAAYNVSKAGVVSMSETLYGELKMDNVGVTVICPEFFPTNLLKESRFVDPQALKFAQRAFDKSPFTAEDVANAAVDAMKQKRLYVVLPSAARFRWYFKRFHPQKFLNKVAEIMARATGGRKL
jgi:NAD(P)-dependent dehydrogenase (short-subunit alcohol dehydrogenase family)